MVSGWTITGIWIVSGDALIQEFSHDEIETVLAHKLSHHANRDIPVGIAVSTLITLIGLYLADLALRWGVDYFLVPDLLPIGYDR